MRKDRPYQKKFAAEYNFIGLIDVYPVSNYAADFQLSIYTSMYTLRPVLCFRLLRTCSRSKCKMSLKLKSAADSVTKFEAGPVDSNRKFCPLGPFHVCGPLGPFVARFGTDRMAMLGSVAGPMWTQLCPFLFIVIKLNSPGTSQTQLQLQ